MNDELEDFLEHFGIKGMKWGHRNTKRTRTPSSEDSTIARDIRKKPARTLTNKELKDANQRTKLETEFRRMNPTKVQKGHATAKALLAIAGVSTLSIPAIMNSNIHKKVLSVGQKAVKAIMHRRKGVMVPF